VDVPTVDWTAIYRQLAVYLELLMKWNERTNLTAIREPEEIVRRHFGESLFAASFVRKAETLLDFGSGAGFPGVPIQMVRPDVRVTLAESQGKKAAFLREAVRTLGLEAAEVWDQRVEAMPAERRFDVVAMRAVDNMAAAAFVAAERGRSRLLIFATDGAEEVEFEGGFRVAKRVRMPESRDRVLLIAER
jgi:16S rRNA (guanine527-N7)-methyltransferase